MKLKALTYNSPVDTEGTYENVYIEDVSYEIKRTENFFAINFEMYHIKNSKRVVLDTFRISFRGTNAEHEQGLPTTNKTAFLRITNPNYDPNIPSTIEAANPEYNPEIPVTIVIVNPDYDENVEGSLPTMEIPNPDYISPTIVVPNPDYVSEKSVVPLLDYLYSHQGVMPAEYEVVDWGYPTYENVMGYFSGGTLTNPELHITDPFAKEWLKNNMQMKGEFIKEQFDFI